MRNQHNMVKIVDISPGEKYLVTYHSQEPSNPQDASKVGIKIFDVRAGRMMRGFKGSVEEFSNRGLGGVAGASWPVFRWAGGKDDKHFAKLNKNTIYVYETETFSLIDKKSMKIANVVDICWSPTD